MTTAKTTPVRKAGRPKGAKNKPKTVAAPKELSNKPVPEGKTVKPKEQDTQQLLAYLNYLSTYVDSLNAKVESLEHQAIQYQAVISYLEAKLDI